MSEDKLECYVLPSLPLPLLLPLDCIAEVVVSPSIQDLDKAQTSWMKGHVNWQNQRLPVMSYAALLNSDLGKTNKKPSKAKEHLVVLNAIPGAARKAYSALLCNGEVSRVIVDNTIDYKDIPEGIDKRYVDAVVSFDKKDFIVPKLASLAVAFTYI